ncbi:MAG: PepSY domain-containing protein [Gemmatimonadaceae bacterium]|nr:PepSY domain-containing protein [Gemmatimonadaceae bacterium]
MSHPLPPPPRPIGRVAARAGSRASGAPPSLRRTLSRVAFHGHLWLGVLSTVALLVIAITGILLNHKRGLGLMPEVEHTPSGAFTESVSLEQLARAALEAVPQAARKDWQPGQPVDVGLIDRMDARPRNGFVKVRLRDAASTEVTVDLHTGRVLHVGERGDVFFEKLHSGEIFGGQPYVLLSDVAAIALVITLITGYWLWLAPKMSRAPSGGGDGA